MYVNDKAIVRWTCDEPDSIVTHDKGEMVNYGDHVRAMKEEYYRGWEEGVRDYAIWKNGEQVVGCMERPLGDVLEKKRKELGI